MDSVSRIRNSPEHLLRMLGVRDDEMFRLWRPYGPDEWCPDVSLSGLEKEIKNHGIALIERIDGDEVSRMVFVDSKEKSHECITIDFDCIVPGGAFIFGFIGRKLYFMRPEDMRECGFHFQSFSGARVASSP
jgi:hypothetical protein